jgi:hypothetical protein
MTVTGGPSTPTSTSLNSRSSTLVNAFESLIIPLQSTITGFIEQATATLTVSV